jgi:hypothetical protein
MADNINVDPGTGVGAVPVATDDVGGIQYQVIKIATGGDGAATVISSANPLPMSDAGGSLTVDGTVAVTGISSTAPDRGAGVTTSQTLRVSIASEQVDGSEYETVAASQTDQVIGATGATGDFLSAVLVIPATTAPGVVTIKDNTTAVISWPGGTLPSVIPFTIPVGANSVNGAWKITTGANVSVFASGNFT